MSTLIITATIPHSGTRFLNGMINLNKDVTTIQNHQPRGILSSSTNALHYKDWCSSVINDYLPGAYSHLFLTGHYHHEPLLIPIFVAPETIKDAVILSPVRHPAAVFHSIYRDNGWNDSYVLYFDLMIDAIKKGHVIPVPVDLLGYLDIPKRMAIMQDILGAAGIEINDDIQKYIEDWVPVGGDNDLSLVDDRWVSFANKIGLVAKLNDAGFPYGEKPGEPISEYQG